MNPRTIPRISGFLSVGLFNLASLLTSPLSAGQFFIAPHGNDAHPGTRAEPFASLSRARDAVRELKKTEPIEIILREGVYSLDAPLRLDPRDSGTQAALITWRAAKGEKVVLSGGTVITSTWQTDDGKIWWTELPEVKQGQWNFRQLFVDGQRMTRARFPNKSEANPFLYATGGGMDHVLIDPDQIQASWGTAPDAQINMVPNWRFFNQWNTVTGVDASRGRIDLADSERHAKIIAGNWFWIEGLKEELDEPGEWYLDRAEGRLYYMPGPGIDPNTQHIVAPRLNGIIEAKGEVEQRTHVEYVNFHGLELRHTTFSLGHIEARVHTDAAIRLENALHCSISDCHFENIGGYALWLHLDSNENHFDKNTVLYAGGGGVLLTGSRFSYMDDSKLFTPGEVAAKVFPILNRITRNTVKHSGKIRYYGGGVHLDSRPASMAMAAGNYIAHNHFQDLSRNGIFAFRNQGGNVVEYNHIHDVMQTTIDGAAIHFATMNHLNAPNYILNNWLYDIWGYEQKPDGQPKRHLANGIFLDWDSSNMVLKNNYVYNAGGTAIKVIWNNWNVTKEGNQSSIERIVPPFLAELGPGGTATHGIDPESTRLVGRVIHYSDQKLVTRTGDWEKKTLGGMWGLFKFHVLKVPPNQSAEIDYRIPVPEDGTYQLSLLYKPQKNNATNAMVAVHHAEGIATLKWNMQSGNRHGFAVNIGKYPFKKGQPAKIVIFNQGANGVVVADSVAYVKVSDALFTEGPSSPTASSTPAPKLQGIVINDRDTEA